MAEKSIPKLKRKNYGKKYEKPKQKKKKPTLTHYKPKPRANNHKENYHAQTTTYKENLIILNITKHT